ncbi:MAG: DUF1990 family protein [Candidatus Dormibacteraeota bacterium]|uniref:DUF1990 family protein n=1 Tax=Candidatus Aeolococcus gillhamiae TaxID=3127015 RepID=A0A2W5Z6E5_9BACT|nr:DUF1990 family protein [Candidatus Dormibacteraeota bacterium]PZR78445.1 MAG: hypothetical protein DLM65_13125 [Candidatus Dormibacter sp. RRmetagenome_bin12]
MSRRDRLLGPPRVRRRLAALARAPINFDPGDLQHASAATGWKIDDLCQDLGSEPPGDPVPGGTWELARALLRGYAFADPSIVRAYYDPDVPLMGRTLLLKLRALGLLHVYAGVRVSEVRDATQSHDGRDVRLWGWSYRTLQGHVEEGQMDWEVWKWRDTGVVEFRVHAVWRRAAVPNPVVRVGVAVLRAHERALFLASTARRMRVFTALAARADDSPAVVREAARQLSARGGDDVDITAEELEEALREVRAPST